MRRMDESVIPEGVYCYSHTGEKNELGMPKLKVCPYWGQDLTKPKQANGFCTFLDIRDWDDAPGIPLLWDQVKECGINRDLTDKFKKLKSKLVEE